MKQATAHKALVNGEWLNWELGQDQRKLIFTEAALVCVGNDIDIRAIAVASFPTGEACEEYIRRGAALLNLCIAKVGVAALPGYINKEAAMIRDVNSDVTAVFVVWQKYGDPFMNYEFRAILRTEMKDDETGITNCGRA